LSIADIRQRFSPKPEPIQYQTPDSIDLGDGGPPVYIIDADPSWGAKDYIYENRVYKEITRASLRPLSAAHPAAA